MKKTNKTEFLRVRVTPRMKLAFERYCEQRGIDGPQWMRNTIGKLVGLKDKK